MDPSREAVDPSAIASEGLRDRGDGDDIDTERGLLECAALICVRAAFELGGLSGPEPFEMERRSSLRVKKSSGLYMRVDILFLRSWGQGWGRQML